MPTCTSVSSRRSRRGPSICERWLPLWRALLRYQSEAKKLTIRIKRIRAAMVARLELVYRPELSTLPKAERTQLLVALDILTDFESWGMLREGHDLSIEAAREVWMDAIGRMLPTVHSNPEVSRIRLMAPPPPRSNRN